MQRNAPLNILICGGGFANKGAEALACVVQRELSARLPESRFFMQSRDAQAALVISKGITPVLPRQGGRIRKLTAVLSVLVGRSLSSRNHLASTVGETVDVGCLIPAVDAVVDISGFGFGDVWGPRKDRLRWMQLFDFLGKPAVFLPQAWGPFKRRDVALCTARMLYHADFAYARDRESHSYLRNLRTVPSDKIGLAPDIAFLFEGGRPEEAIATLGGIGIPVREKPLVGIAPNMRVYERTKGGGAANQYVRLLLSIAKHFTGDEGCSVVLIPHQIRPLDGERPDDRFLCELIVRSLGTNGNLSALLGDYSAQTLKAVIGQLDFLVGSRFHSLVAAFSQLVPAAAIGWSHKYFHLFDDVGLKDFALGHSSLEDKDSFSAILQAWKERVWIKKQLTARIPVQRRSAAAALDHAAEIIRGRCW